MTGQKERQKFMEQYRCEQDPTKRKWEDFLDDVIDGNDKPYVFAQIETLHEGRVPCLSRYCMDKEGCHGF